MPATPYGPNLNEIARQWHDLAERRLTHYEELYRSGRWKHYFRSREAFEARMLDVIAAAKTFRRLANLPSPSPAASDLRPAA